MSVIVLLVLSDVIIAAVGYLIGRRSIDVSVIGDMIERHHRESMVLPTEPTESA